MQHGTSCTITVPGIQIVSSTTAVAPSGSLPAPIVVSYPVVGSLSGTACSSVHHYFSQMCGYNRLRTRETCLPWSSKAILPTLLTSTFTWYI